MYDEERDEERQAYYRLTRDLYQPDGMSSPPDEAPERKDSMSEKPEPPRYSYTILRGHYLGQPYAVTEGLTGSIVHPCQIASFVRAKDALIFVTA